VTSVTWGSIIGTLGDQTDLATALNAKLASADAASTYAPIASPTFTGTVTIPAGASISGFAPLASPALTGNVTINSNSTGPALFIEQAGTGNILTLHDQATDTNFVAIDQNGKISTIPSEAANGAGFNIAHGVAPTTPVNGDIWTTTTAVFARINASTKQMMTLSDTQTVSGAITFTSVNQTLGNSTGAGTINVASGATISASTKTVNVATGGVVGSTTNTTIGPVLGASTTSIGGTTAASTLNLAAGATLTATTKAVNIGTAGVAGSTTNIAIGSTTGTSTTTLQGTTNGVTAAADTNSVALATTAYVVGQAGSATPLVNGTAAVGTSLRYARQDHVHGTDTTRAPLASPTFSGTPSLPTGTTGVTQTAGNNTTALATTAFVTAAVPAFATSAQALALTSNTVSVSPLTLQRVIMHPGFRRLTSMAGNSVSTTSGTGSSNYVSSNWIETVGPSSGSTGSAMVTPANVSGFDAIGRLSENNIDFSKRIILCGKFSQAASSGFLGDANNYWMFSLGKASAYSGDFTGRAIGIRKFGSTANFFLVVHNGTTLTAVDSGVGNNSYSATTDFTIVSDGAGNVTLFIDDNQVATTSAGPTGTATSGSRIYAEVNQVGTFGARIGAHTGNIGTYIAP
jgi:hypothetical protein